MRKLYLTLVTLILAVNLFANNEIIVGKVSKVHDGDSIHVMSGDKRYVIRFYGIDAPELKQSYGIKSRDYLRSLIMGKNVKVKIKEKDRYGRNVSKVYYKGTYINEKMVQNGYAFWYEQYAKRDMDLKSAGETAKRYSRGAWSDPNMMKPWEYRKKK